MKKLPIRGRTLALLAILLPLFLLFVYTGLRSGPLAPVPVVVTTVNTQPLTPALFGIGTVEARYTYKIGPTFAGRLKQLQVHVGDQVTKGQVLGEMDPVDLDDKIRALDAGLKRAEAMLKEAKTRHTYAQTQANRYAKLAAARATSKESADTKQHELQITTAALSVAKEELARITADRDALYTQRDQLRLIAPSDGLVVLRNANPGTTIVAGQSVIELIDPQSLWLHVRFDQSSAAGLVAGLDAQIVLRSRKDQSLNGTVLRIEPKADAVTEELLAKVTFNQLPQPLPSLGELTEVTLSLPTLEARPVIPNSSIRRYEGEMGVWQITDGDLRFTPIQIGAADLNGSVQVLEGLAEGDQIVSYSEKALSQNRRIKVVDAIAGVSP
ncbi:MAG TPA: efflux RND transporter periplasmic adaptor subunit [Alcaligenaceae bacterium]|nr:efflux RND transporter periplasmic adaptor subunit [Alcaligenaceae bacterium]